MIQQGFCNWIQFVSSIFDLSKDYGISIVLMIISALHKLYEFLKNCIIGSNRNKPKGMSSIGHGIVINGPVSIIYNVVVNKN